MSDGERWWLPGAMVGLVGVCAIVAGFAAGGPDVVGGIVFGVVALAAAAVILRRRSIEAKTPKDPE